MTSNPTVTDDQGLVSNGDIEMNANGLQDSDPDTYSIEDGNEFTTNSRHSNAVYETKYQKSLRHYLTREALPQEGHYRDLNSIVEGGRPYRPTLEDLHDQNTFQSPQKRKGSTRRGDSEEPQQRGKVVKFGWIKGVYMPCLLNIWGVMLFLRLTWVVGQAGLMQTILIICFSNVVTTITTLSMSAVATNGKIKAGGAYYMISRALGPEFGGSIGFMFTIANSIASATYIIGFCDSLRDMCSNYWGAILIDGTTNDTRVIGTATLILMLILAVVGMEWVTRVQVVLLFLLIGSQINLIIGLFIGPKSTQEQAEGYTGFNGNIMSENFHSEYRYSEGKQQSFFSVFAVFFPAVTGIIAGANMSGDLKDPGTAIPKGTLAAILTTFVTYIIYPIMVSAAVARDATGNASQIIYGDNITADNQLAYTSCSKESSAEVEYCTKGLQNDFQVMSLVSGYGPIIYAGCFGATLSSAIASLVGGPRVLQALAKDRLYPGIHIFEVGYGANNDPVRGYVLVFVVSLICIMIGDLNLISSLLSNFFLASYCLINFSCFHSSLINVPGWRPSFKYYNKWVSLVGGILCVLVMFAIDWKTALITFGLIIALYSFVSHRKPDVNWGSSTQAQIYINALKSTQDLMQVEDHVKNFRPQILVLTSGPSSRPPLIDFANTITKKISLLTVGHISKATLTPRSRSNMTKEAYRWFSAHHIQSFYSLAEADNMEEGAKQLFNLVGLGKLRPNMVMLGYKANWGKCEKQELKAYFGTLHETLNMNFGLCILRVPQGLDYSGIVESSTEAAPSSNGISDNTTNTGFNTVASTNSLESSATAEATHISIQNLSEIPSGKEELKRKPSSALYRGPGGVELSKDVLDDITMFQRKQKKGTIDVWWLYDDGGLTLLLPYILTTRSKWSDCSLRIFTLGNRKNELAMEQRSMANLLSKFRIDFDDVTVIADVAQKAQESTRIEFEDLIANFKEKEADTNAKNTEEMLISEDELSRLNEKTNRHLRLRELLQENSKDASLVVMTLPMPRKSSVSAPLYMAWLEMITRDMPPFLLIRGNQQSVLTYYS